LDELVFQPNVDETQIGVLVDEGVVTLTGILDSYSKNMLQERLFQK
jgi:osmotically-inducible protein OsmY